MVEDAVEYPLGWVQEKVVIKDFALVSIKIVEAAIANGGGDSVTCVEDIFHNTFVNKMENAREEEWV